MRKVMAAIAVAVLAWSAPLVLGQAEPVAKDQQQQTRTLTGRVFSRQGDPIDKAVVYLKNTKSLAVKTYITDPDGTYRFPALSPNVDYEIYAEYSGARSDTKTLSAFDSRKEANITLRVK
jgi:protocatechuate 3,4-dioxygenase beta subunit